MARYTNSGSTSFPDREHVVGLLQQFHVFDKTVRTATFQELKTLDRERVMPILTNLLTDPDEELRGDAAEALVHIDAHEGVNHILSLLTDPVEAVRWHVCGLLSAFGDQRAVTPLARVVLEDPADDVRFMAALALREIGDIRALPALQQVQQEDHGMDYEGRRIDDMAAQAIAAIIARQSTQ